MNLICKNCNSEFEKHESVYIKDVNKMCCPFCFSNELTIGSKEQIKQKHESINLIKDVKGVKGFVYFYETEIDYKIIPLHNLTPYLYMKDYKKLYSLDKPKYLLNGKPIYYIHRNEYISKESINDLDNKDIVNKVLYSHKQKLVKHLYDKPKSFISLLSKYSFWIILFSGFIISTLFVLEIIKETVLFNLLSCILYFLILLMFSICLDITKT